MLPRLNRLRAKRDFKRTMAGQRLASNGFFAIYGLLVPMSVNLSAIHPPASPVALRIGFVVSKKVHKRAVVRNRIKRRLREIFRLWLLCPQQAAALADWRSIVVIARPGSVDADYRTLERALTKSLRIPSAQRVAS
jgi:ribonuclease P protein component